MPPPVHEKTNTLLLHSPFLALKHLCLCLGGIYIHIPYLSTAKRNAYLMVVGAEYLHDTRSLARSWLRLVWEVGYSKIGRYKFFILRTFYIQILRLSIVVSDTPCMARDGCIFTILYKSCAHLLWNFGGTCQLRLFYLRCLVLVLCCCVARVTRLLGWHGKLDT